MRVHLWTIKRRPCGLPTTGRPSGGTARWSSHLGRWRPCVWMRLHTRRALGNRSRTDAARCRKLHCGRRRPQSRGRTAAAAARATRAAATRAATAAIATTAAMAAMATMAAPGLLLGAWLEPHPSGLSVRSGGLSLRTCALRSWSQLRPGAGPPWPPWPAATQ